MGRKKKVTVRTGTRSKKTGKVKERHTPMEESSKMQEEGTSLYPTVHIRNPTDSIHNVSKISVKPETRESKRLRVHFRAEDNLTPLEETETKESKRLRVHLRAEDNLKPLEETPKSRYFPETETQESKRRHKQRQGSSSHDDTSSARGLKRRFVSPETEALFAKCKDEQDKQTTEEKVTTTKKSPCEFPDRIQKHIQAFREKMKARSKAIMPQDTDDEADITDSDNDKEWKPEKEQYSSDEDSSYLTKGQMDEDYRETHESEPEESSPKQDAGSTRPDDDQHKHTLKDDVSLEGKKRKKVLKGPRTQRSSTPRPRITCPTCGSLVVHLQRHLRNVHELANSNAKVLANQAKRTGKDKSTYKICPIKDCPSIVKRLDMHLNNVHNISPKESKKLTRYANVLIKPDVEPQTTMKAMTAERRDLPDSSFKIKTDVRLPSATASFYKDVPQLENFREWLSSVERGKNATSAKQHTQQVLKIWRSVDASMGMGSIQDGKLVKTFWLEPSRQSLQASSLISHLGSLLEFLNFVKATKVAEYDPDKHSALIDAINRWKNTLGKERRIRNVERAVQDTEEMLTPGAINEALSSRQAAVARNYLNGANNGEFQRISLKIYTKARNFLMLYILARNAQRSGAIKAINMRSYNYAQLRDDGSRIVAVASHKTGYRTPATISLTSEMWTLMTAFLKMRKMISNFDPDLQKGTSPIFLSYNCKPMSSSDVNTAINSFWREAVQNPLPISATKIRKATVTHVRSTHPNLRDTLASHMTHRPSTQDAVYMLHDKQQETHDVTGVIADVMIGNLNERDDDEDLNDLDEPSSLHSHPRRSFTLTDANTIRDACAGLINNNGPILQGTVISLLEADEKGKRLVEKYPAKKLADRVRAARRSLKEKP